MIRLRRPSWFAIALTVTGVVVFVLLGIWQWNRGGEKEQLLQRFSTAASAPLVPFESLPATVAPTRYPHVRVHGEYLGERTYVLDNQMRDGRHGVQVFVPMHVSLACALAADAGCTADSDVLLVGLGFLPRMAGSHTPVEIPALPSGAVTVSGLYAPAPGSGVRLGGNALARQSDWPKLTTYLDLGQVAADLQRTLYPRVLLLDADPASRYVRVWSPHTMPPEKHYGYAFQWFALAVASLAIFVVLHRKRKPRKDEDEHEQDPA